jgi:hypothetical protein
MRKQLLLQYKLQQTFGQSAQHCRQQQQQQFSLMYIQASAPAAVVHADGAGKPLFSIMHQYIAIHMPCAILLLPAATAAAGAHPMRHLLSLYACCTSAAVLMRHLLLLLCLLHSCRA